MPLLHLLRVEVCDAIKNVAGGTVRTKRFPPTTLIRLYELLKNDSRSFDRMPKQSVIAWASDEKTMVEDDGIEPTTPCLQSRCSPS
jgi:hypothetical protein